MVGKSAVVVVLCIIVWSLSAGVWLPSVATTTKTEQHISPLNYTNPQECNTIHNCSNDCIRVKTWRCNKFDGLEVTEASQTLIIISAN